MLNLTKVQTQRKHIGIAEAYALHAQNQHIQAVRAVRYLKLHLQIRRLDDLRVRSCGWHHRSRRWDLSSISRSWEEVEIGQEITERAHEVPVIAAVHQRWQVLIRRRRRCRRRCAVRRRSGFLRPSSRIPIASIHRRRHGKRTDGLGLRRRRRALAGERSITGLCHRGKGGGAWRAVVVVLLLLVVVAAAIELTPLALLGVPAVAAQADAVHPLRRRGEAGRRGDGVLVHDPARAALDAFLVEVERVLPPLDLLAAHAHALPLAVAALGALPPALALPSPAARAAPLLAAAPAVHGPPRREEEGVPPPSVLPEEEPRRRAQRVVLEDVADGERLAPDATEEVVGDDLLVRGHEAEAWRKTQLGGHGRR
jgi:hypothetical protein